MTPRLTVLTPSYNQAPFLRQCIDSVLGQDYPDLQYIVLDGGSSDGTLDILRSYGDAITWRSRPDGGQAAALNEGFALAEGDVVAWLNSDDYYLPAGLTAATTLLADRPDARMLYGHALMVDEHGETLRRYPTHDLHRRDLARKCYVCQPSVFVRRELIEESRPLNEHLDLCLDYDWWLRISRDHAIVFCDRALAASRHYEQTKTASRRLRALVEAGYLMRHHFGHASWRWSAKWVVHRWTLDRRRYMTPLAGWAAALASARRYRRRFDSKRTPSRYGKKLLATLR